MTKTTTKAKKATPTPPATTPEKKFMEPHEIVTAPMVQNAIGIDAWGKFAGEADLGGIVKSLAEVIEKVQGGNMKPVESMLCGQAMTLQTIFTNLARRAASNESLVQFQANMTLALKAQAQCRATLEALAEIKNPRPVAFVKQANISNGPQQVNNGASGAVSAETATVRAGSGAHAEETQARKTDYWRHRMATSWTPERRARQAVLIRTWRPWAQATGPRTPDGKATASRNAYKGGHWLMLRELSRMVNAEIREARDLVDSVRQ